MRTEKNHFKSKEEMCQLSFNETVMSSCMTVLILPVTRYLLTLCCHGAE